MGLQFPREAPAWWIQNADLNYASLIEKGTGWGGAGPKQLGGGGLHLTSVSEESSTPVHVRLPSQIGITYPIIFILPFWLEKVCV